MTVLEALCPLLSRQQQAGLPREDPSGVYESRALLQGPLLASCPWTGKASWPSLEQARSGIPTGCGLSSAEHHGPRRLVLHRERPEGLGELPCIMRATCKNTPRWFGTSLPRP
jgi:hypothetical protein